MNKNQVHTPRIIMLVAMLAAVGQITNTIAVPAMTAIAHSLLIQIHYVQWLIAAYLLPYGLSQFIYGPLSDRLGRRPIILFGLGIYIAGSVITVIAANFSMLLGGTLIQGAGIGVGGVMCRTALRDILKGKKLHQANSKMSMLLIIAPLLAPLIGGILNDFFVWRAIYIFLLIFAMACYMLQLKYLPETNSITQRCQHGWFKLYKNVLGDCEFRAYTMLLLLSFSGVAVFEACASLLFSNVLGYSATTMSLLFIIPLPLSIIGSYISGILCKLFSIQKICLLAIIIMGASSASLLYFALQHIINISVILCPIAGFLLGLGIIFPAATTGALNPFSATAGSAGAILGGLQNLGAASCTAISSMFMQTSQLPLAIILSTLCGCMCLVLLRLKLLEIKTYAAHGTETM